LICRYIFKTAIIFIIVLIHISAQADDLTYKSVIVDALRHSANIRIKIEDIKISEAQYKSSFAGLFPSINLSGRAERFENLDDRNSTNIESIGNEIVGGYSSAWRSSVNFTGQYYFSNWYKKRYETKYYERLKDSSIHGCESEAKKVVKDVTDLYGSMLESKLKLDYSEKILADLKKILKIKKEALAIGQFALEEILKAESDVTTMEKEIAKVRKDLFEQFHRLSVYTGGHYSENEKIDLLSFRGSEFSFFDEKSAVASSPEFKMRLQEMEAIRAKTVLSRNSLLPDVSIYGRYDLFNSSQESLDASFRDTRPVSYSAGILVSIPIFDGGAKYWEWKKNTYEIRKQEETLRATFEENSKNIKTISDSHKNTLRSYQHFKKLHDQYEKMMTISKKALELGERSQLDILELEKDALGIERDVRITEQTLAIYEQQMSLEIDFNKYLREYNGNWACSY